MAKLDGLGGGDFAGEVRRKGLAVELGPGRSHDQNGQEYCQADENLGGGQLGSSQGLTGKCQNDDDADKAGEHDNDGRGQGEDGNNDDELNDGQRYNIYEIGLTVMPYRKVINSIKYSLQYDDQFENQWLRKDEAVTVRERISFSNIPSGMNLNYEYTYRKKQFKEIPGTDNRQNLSYLTGSYLSGPVSIEYNHKYNRTRAALKIERYIKVDEGTGDYRFENEEYIPDPFGDYIRIMEEAGDYRPVSEVENTVRLFFNGRRLTRQKRLFNRIRIETTVDFSTEQIRRGTG